MNKLAKTLAVFGTAGMIMTGAMGTATAQAGQSVDSVQLPAPDNKERTASPLPEGGGKKIHLQPGDRLELRSNAKEAVIINADNLVVGVFDSPSIQIGDREYPAHFEINGDELHLSTDQGVRLPRSCFGATVGKWSYRVLAGLTCGAAGLGTGPIAGPVVGGACSLGASGLEDRLDFNQSCRP